VRKRKGIPSASKPSPIPGGALNPPGQQEKEGKERNARNSFKEYQPRFKERGVVSVSFLKDLGIDS
jgi:hypothetical protein